MIPSSPVTPSSMPPELRKAVGGLQAATDDAAAKTVPPTKFGVEALNELIGAINEGNALFGPKAKALQLATKPGTIPVEVMKRLLMFDKVATDLGREPLTDAFDGLHEDMELMTFAGMVSSFLKDPEVRVHLRSPAPMPEPMMDEPVVPEASAPEASPTERLKKLLRSGR